MRLVVRTLPPLLIALGLTACGGEATPPPATTGAASTAPTRPADPAVGTDTLRQRAADALGANRLYTPAGDNAVEDYLALREREPGDAAVATALADLAPYVIIGAEQAIAAEAFPEAARLVGLLSTMDADAPAVPRLRDALATATADAEARAEAEQLAGDAARRRTDTPRAAPSATPDPSPAQPPSPPGPAEATSPARPAVAATAPTAPNAEPASAPISASVPAPPRPPAAAPRTLVTRTPPRFPEAALRRRLEGEVELNLRIAADGSVEAVDLLRADPPGVFDREAVLAVRRWRYAPADAASDARVVLQFKRP